MASMSTNLIMVCSTSSIYITCFESMLTWIFKVVKTPAETHRQFDYIVCAHKAINQDSVPKQLEPVIENGKTTIVIIQNGVGNEEPFRKAFPECSIITCVVRSPWRELNVSATASSQSCTDMGRSHPISSRCHSTFPLRRHATWPLSKLQDRSWLRAKAAG